MTNYEFDYHQYRKHLNNRSGFPVSIILVTIILLVGVMVYLKPSIIEKTDFYFVEVGSFNKFSSASNLATETQQKGGAGYIYFDNNYHVFVNLYLKKQDAEAVVNNIKNEYNNAKIFKISSKKYKNNKNFTQKQINIIKNTLKTNLSTIETISQISQNYDKNLISDIEIKNDYLMLKNNYENQQIIFSSTFSDRVSNEYINATSEILRNYASKDLNGNSIKYSLIKITLNHISLLDAL